MREPREACSAACKKQHSALSPLQHWQKMLQLLLGQKATNACKRGMQQQVRTPEVGSLCRIRHRLHSLTQLHRRNRTLWNQTVISVVLLFGPSRAPSKPCSSWPCEDRAKAKKQQTAHFRSCNSQSYARGRQSIVFQSKSFTHSPSFIAETAFFGT